MATSIQLKKQKEFLNKNGRKKLNKFTIEQLVEQLNQETRVKFQRKIRNRIRDLSKQEKLVVGIE